MVPTIMFSFNMMEAARRCKVKRFMFTSSIGVYAPNKIFKEDDVWKTFPSQNDKFAGWAKRICELQAEAYKIQYNLKNFHLSNKLMEVHDQRLKVKVRFYCYRKYQQAL